jgi:hypothetical protein
VKNPDPGQRQQHEHLVAPTGPVESQHLVGGDQHLPQMPGLTRHDRRLVIAEPTVVEVQPVLVAVQPLPGDSLQHLHLDWGMRRPDVLDLPRPTPVRMHDLHRGRLARGLHRPNIRHQHRLENPASLVHNAPTKALAKDHFNSKTARPEPSRVTPAPETYSRRLAIEGDFRASGTHGSAILLNSPLLVWKDIPEG